MTKKVTAKMLLSDCVTLAADTGIFLYSAAKALCSRIKGAFGKRTREKPAVTPVYAADGAVIVAPD